MSRTPSEKGIAFVNILIISVTLIVVAVPEGMYLQQRLISHSLLTLGKVYRWLLPLLWPLPRNG
jgi:hypothetical protein